MYNHCRLLGKLLSFKHHLLLNAAKVCIVIIIITTSIGCHSQSNENCNDKLACLNNHNDTPKGMPSLPSVDILINNVFCEVYQNFDLPSPWIILLDIEANKGIVLMVKDKEQVIYKPSLIEFTFVKDFNQKKQGKSDKIIIKMPENQWIYNINLELLKSYQSEGYALKTVNFKDYGPTGLSYSLNETKNQSKFRVSNFFMLKVESPAQESYSTPGDFIYISEETTLFELQIYMSSKLKKNFPDFIPISLNFKFEPNQGNIKVINLLMSRNRDSMIGHLLRNKFENYKFSNLKAIEFIGIWTTQ